MLKELFEFLSKNNITPDHFKLLYYLSNNIQPKIDNIDFELILLQRDGWLNDNMKLTPKAIKLVNDIDTSLSVKRNKNQKTTLGIEAIDYVRKYRSLFPVGVLPSGVQSRVSEKILLSKFEWFFNYFDKYTWSDVLKATEQYINRMSPTYKGMRNSQYFIKKEDTNREIISDLATECDALLEGDQIEIDYSDRIN